MSDLGLGRYPAPTATIDLSAIRHNVRLLRAHAGHAGVMAVVKADGYGHGAVAVARASIEAGAAEIGVATIGEALQLRRADIRSPILCWLHSPGAPYRAALHANIRLGVSSVGQLQEVVAAAHAEGTRAEVDVKLDTGLHRNGSPAGEWPTLMSELVRAERSGSVIVRGLFSHLACADEPGHSSIDLQREALLAGITLARNAGLNPTVNHLANSAATLTRPDTRFDLVRTGIALYGLTPISVPGNFGLRAAMTLTTPIASVRTVAAGDAVSYGHTWVATQRTNVALIPLGYADGVPRALSGRFSVTIGGRRYPAVGRICMDQFLVDLGPGHSAITAGTEVTLFGPAESGAPVLQEWANALDTIQYELVTGVRGRVTRRYVKQEAP
jgi:alanine racemase